MRFALTLEARGNGYATEAAAAVIRWALRQEGVKSISATIPDDNQASRRLAQRLGLRRTKEARRSVPLWIVHSDEMIN